MKKIVALYITTIMSCVLYSQIFEYEWKDITPDDFSMTIAQSVSTKGGNVVVATKEGWLAMSSDTGKTWEQTYSLKGQKLDVITKSDEVSYQPLAFKFAKDSLHGIFASVSNENGKYINNVLYTVDGGNSWTSSLLELKDSDKIVTTAWSDEQTVFLTVLDTSSNKVAIYKSSDYGEKWALTTNDVFSQEVLPQSKTFYMAFVNNQLGYVFANVGYSMTNDGGMTWKAEQLRIAPEHLFQFQNGYIILTVSSQISKTLEGCRIINMYDWGNGVIAYYNVPESMYDLGNGKVWATVSGGYDIDNNKIISTDSMRTWQFTKETYTPPTDVTTTALNNTRYSYIYNGNMEGKDIFVKSKNEIFIIGQKNGRMFYSSNGGKTWDYKDFNTTLYKMQFFPNDVIYMTSTDSLFISRDGGKSWSGKDMHIDDFSGTKVRNMQFFTESFGYVYDNIELYQTINGGDTWENIRNISMDFYNYGGSLTYGCFANKNIGLFPSEDSKTILLANVNVNSEKKRLTFSLVSEDNVNRIAWINTAFHDGKWILMDRINGHVYTCDTTEYNFKKVWQGSEYYAPMYAYSTLLAYSKDTLVIPSLSDALDYPNDTVLVSIDGGETWHEESVSQYPPIEKISKADNNVIYGIPTLGNMLRIYKGIRKVKTLEYSFEKQENGTIQCTINNADNQNYTAKVVLEQVNGTSIVVQDNVEIKSGEAFVITLPQNITANYVIKVIPEDEEVYETVQSQEFIVNNGGSAIDAVSSDEIQIRVVNGRIECDCEDYTIYNVAGQKVQNNALPSGTYFVHCNQQVKKVIVQ